ncbi:MAG: NUDIX domain-containing protein [Rikenellaceae bacterium]
MTIETNHSLSVDCVIFGFNGTQLKVLLIESRESEYRKKLPGGMILENETLPAAAERVLSDLTGLSGIYLRQAAIYSDPNRVESGDLKWINRNHGVNSHRVVSVGYYALLKLNTATLRHTSIRGAYWCSVDSVGELMMDHNTILKDTLKRLKSEIVSSPIAFELLPKQFTIRALQDLYSAVLGIEIDKRNFRRKILNSGLLHPTGKREVGVAHKPAEYFTFNHAEYKKRVKRDLKLAFL